MNENVSFSIPATPGSLLAMAEALEKMSAELPTCVEKHVINQPVTEPTPPAVSTSEVDTDGPDGSDFDETPPVERTPDEAFGDKPPAPPANTSLTEPLDLSQIPPENFPIPNEFGVLVDSRGFVHDGRIHMTSKDNPNGKTKKKDGEWQNKRGVDANLVAQVEAELADMRDEGLNPELNSDTPPPAPPTPPAPPVPPTPPAAEQKANIGPLMAAVTAAGIAQSEVLRVLQSNNIPSMVQLRTRPDLIPKIAAELGVTVNA